jgi:MFS family permease
VATVRSERRWTALAVMMLCLVVISLDNTILNVALRTIQHDLRASGGDMQWAVNAYTLAFASLVIPFGLLGDRHGRRLVLMAGLTVFAVGSALSAWTTTPGQLIATRTLMGVGAATLMPTTLSIITNIFPAAQRPRAIGLWSASVGIGIAIGPVAGGYLLEHWWWGSIFLVILSWALTFMNVARSKTDNSSLIFDMSNLVVLKGYAWLNKPT